MSMRLIIAIAAGGGIGATARYLVSAWLGHSLGTEFPWGTLAVNVTGGFVMGVLVEIMAFAWSPSIVMRAFLTTGILGGFTTFSAFSLEFAVLAERGAVGAAAAYVLASVAGSIAALFAGLRLVRLLVA